MADDQFSLFPNWDNPGYRRYYLRHQIGEDVWNEWSGADIWRAMASAGLPVSRNMLYEVRKERLDQPEREGSFANLNPDDGIPDNMFEREPYWKMSTEYMYVLHMSSIDDDGIISLSSRAISSDERLTPSQIIDMAVDIFNRVGYENYLGFESAYIAHAYRR